MLTGMAAPLNIIPGLPIAQMATAVLGAWAGEKLLGSSVSLGRAVLLGLTAFGVAQLKDSLMPNLQVVLPIIGDVTRPIAGSLGIALVGEGGVVPVVPAAA
jgi:hypothetical protein